MADSTQQTTLPPPSAQLEEFIFHPDQFRMYDVPRRVSPADVDGFVRDRVDESSKSQAWQQTEHYTELVVPLDEPGTVSYSYASRPGVSYINVRGKRLLELVDDLLHEATHHKLHAIEELAPLVDDDGLQEWWSPWRRAWRPLRGILHAGYTFSHAALIGAPPWALGVARHGLDFMTTRFWDDAHGGWFLTTELDGAPRDRRKDSYAHAFVLFSMAYYFRASGDPEALKIAWRTLDLMEAHLQDRRHGGFLEGASERWEPVSEPRRQNPHMHLLEAFLALHAVTSETRYLAHAKAIAELFATRFFDDERGCRGEYFTEDWGVHPGELGQRVEPGHHFEWVWILHEYAARVGDSSALEQADRLFAFAFETGVDHQLGGVFDETDREGRVLRDTKRLWPQTELLKALTVRYERNPDPETLALLDGAIRHCFSRYVDPGHHGWRDHLTREGRLFTELMPATSLYHITFALTEVLRVVEAAQGRN